jgi:hypothetical protein
MNLADANLRRGEDGEADAAASFEVLHRLAAVHALRCGIDDFAPDLAQHAFAVQLELLAHEGRDFDAEEAARVVRRLAEAEAHAREAERHHILVLARAHRGPEPPPDLCPGLAAVAFAHPKPSAFRARLEAAAHWTARHPGILRNEQFRVFELVHIAGVDAATAATVFRVSRDALLQRLDRISGRIEERIREDLDAVVPTCRLDELDRFLRAKGRRTASRSLADTLFLGLGQVIRIRSLLPKTG